MIAMNPADQQRSSKLSLGLSLLVIIAATALLIYLTYEPRVGSKEFFARSINDATYDCEAKINSRFADQLVHKHFDNLSSRYEADKHQYAIFYRISIEERKPNQQHTNVNDYMVKCLVWEKLGYVSEFTIFDI
jgi:hypothetical protein